MADVIDLVGFLVHTPELVNHFGSVWREMPDSTFEALIPGSSDLYVDSIAACERAGARWRLEEDLLQAGDRYRVLVSNHHGTYVEGVTLKKLGEINVRFMYGMGKSGWNLQDWNSLYDVILCFGPYQADMLARFDAVKVQMGYPRFDTFFNEPHRRDERLATLGCDPSKSTLVYLPTWHHLSSIDHFAHHLLALQEDYNVIVKPHPFTPRDEPGRMGLLKPFRHCVTELINNAELFRVADHIVADYGGSAFGAIYTDRNVLLLDVPDAESDELLTPESPDLLVRDVLPHLSPGQGHLLGDLLANTAIWDEQAAVRRELRRLFFAPYHGFSAKVAALAILNAEKTLSS